VVAAARVMLPLLRGSAEGANCEVCPFSLNGRPGRPVMSEYPVEPSWALIVDGPGLTEVNLGRPVCGPGGQLIDKILARVGRPRDEVFVGGATLCISPRGAPDNLRDLAAKACKPRLQRELAQWPGIPVLTFGAVAARSLIPQETLDAIDPPSVPKSKKKSQKERQRAEAKAQAKAGKDRAKALAKIAKQRLKEMIDYRLKQMAEEMMRPLASDPGRKRKRPPKDLLKRLLDEQHERPRLIAKAEADAITEYELGAEERALQAQFAAANPKPKKPPKPRKIKITDIMGSCFHVDVDGSGPRNLIPTLHPAALLRGGGATIGGTHTPDLAFINMIYDAGKVNALAAGKNIHLTLNIDTEVSDSERTWQMLRDIVFEAIEEGAIAIDLETYVDDPERHHALMAYMAKIRALGLATSKRTISIMWELVPAWAHSYLQLLLAHPHVTKIFHNGIYDQTVLAANGFEMAGPWGDTLLAHHATFPGCAHRLQVVTTQFFATEPWKSEFRNAEETPEGLTRYNAKDTGATHALHSRLEILIKQTKTEEVYDIDRKMARIASEMHLAGMPVSREVNSELLSTFSKNVAHSRRAVEAIADDPKVRDNLLHHLAIQQASKKRKNDSEDLAERYEQRLTEIRLDEDWKWKIGGGKHIAALLQALGVPLHQVTATGQISTKKDVLESLVHVPVVRDILVYRENDKLLSTFVWQLFERRDRDDNVILHGYADGNDRIHPIWSVHKITGRWASSEPVVSNVPKDKWKKIVEGEAISPDWVIRTNKDKSRSYLVRPNLRRQIRAPKGRKFVGGDFEQLESRIIALLSGDPFLCAIFSDPTKDVHREVARVIWEDFDRLDPDTQKQVRERAKPIGYGAMYLAQLDTLHKQLLKDGYNIKRADLEKAMAKLMHAMAGVVQWQRDSVRRASEPPYEVRDMLIGRRRVWPLGQVEATEAVNFPVQCTGASIMDRGLVRMQASLLKYRSAFMWGQFHDAVGVECAEDDAEKIADDMRRDFSQEYERDGRMIKFPFKVAIGDDWSQI
jgi:uracil-DNA glycosylase family 4